MEKKAIVAIPFDSVNGTRGTFTFEGHIFSKDMDVIQKELETYGVLNVHKIYAPIIKLINNGGKEDGND